MTTRAYIVSAAGKRMFRFTVDSMPEVRIRVDGEVTPFKSGDVGDDLKALAWTLNSLTRKKGGRTWQPGDVVDFRVEEDGRGRPREDEDAPQLRRNVNLSAALADRAREIGDGNVSLGIRRALEAYPL